VVWRWWVGRWASAAKNCRTCHFKFKRSRILLQIIKCGVIIDKLSQCLLVMTKYNTNLASEFYVLSVLHRLGADVALTLGNKKSVDIIVANEDGSTTTIDVKGLEKRYDWPFDDKKLIQNKRHFYILVCFEGKITDPNLAPSVWIIPSNELTQFIRKHKTRDVISRAYVLTKGQQYLHAWSLVL
jgi:hypothetical protein